MTRPPAFRYAPDGTPTMPTSRGRRRWLLFLSAVAIGGAVGLWATSNPPPGPNVEVGP